MVQTLSSHPEITSTKILISVFPFGGRWRSSRSVIESEGYQAELIRIPLSYGSSRWMWSTFGFPSVDRRFPPVDIVHGLAYVLPAFGKAKGIVTIHDTSLLQHPEWYPAAARAGARHILHSAKTAHTIIVPSESVRKNLEAIERGWGDKIAVIPYDIQFFNPDASVPDRAPFDIGPMGKELRYLFWAGEINPRKNIPLLFALLSTLHRAGHPHLKLVLAGSRGYQSREILAKAGEYGLRVGSIQDSMALREADVLLSGYITDAQLAEFYTHAALFLFPSWDEGFGYPVLEAMASGTPVIGSCLGSLPELCGNAAVLCNPHDGVEPFFEAARMFLDDPEKRQELVSLGLIQCRQYKSRQMIRKTLQIYEAAYNV